MPFWKCRIGNGDQVPKARMFSLMSFPMKYRSGTTAIVGFKRERKRGGWVGERERWKIQSKWHLHVGIRASLILGALQRKLSLHSTSHFVLTSLIMYK